MTTPDPVALKEALDEVSRLNDPSFDDYTFVMNAGDAKVLADAARWALDLIEGGKEVWWCETHERVSDLDTCCSFGNMVKRLLVTP